METTSTIENGKETQGNSTFATLTFDSIQRLFGSGEYQEDLGASIIDQLSKEIEVIHDASCSSGGTDITHASWRLSARCKELASVVYEFNKELREKQTGASLRELLEAVSPERDLTAPHDVLWSMIDLAVAAGLPTKFMMEVSRAMVSHPCCTAEWKAKHGLTSEGLEDDTEDTADSDNAEVPTDD